MNITARPVTEFSTPDKPLARFWACVLLAFVLIIILVVCVFVIMYKLAIRDIKNGKADPVTTQKYRFSRVESKLGDVSSISMKNSNIL